MSRFAVIVDGPQTGKFREVLGTATVPVCAPVPRWIPYGDKEIFGYRVDLSWLTEEQRQQLDGNCIIPAGDAWSWGNLGALEACTRIIQAAAEKEHQQQHARPRRQPESSPWIVVESEPEPQHTELAVIMRPEPEPIDYRLIAGLHHAVVAADARTRAAEIRAQMAEVRAAASARGQVSVVGWMFAAGLALGLAIGGAAWVAM